MAVLIAVVFSAHEGKPGKVDSYENRALRSVLGLHLIRVPAGLRSFNAEYDIDRYTRPCRESLLLSPLHVTYEVPPSGCQQIALPDHLIQDDMMESRCEWHYDSGKNLERGQKRIGCRYRLQWSLVVLELKIYGNDWRSTWWLWWTLME